MEEFNEAAAVVGVSAKASAAISRRLLQFILSEAFHHTQRDLSKQIDAALEARTLPSHLADRIDSIRAVGNFAAHPLKDSHTGEVVPVEPGEAELLLDTLEVLIDFAYVQPAKLAKSRDSINEKLARAGRPPLKG
jgi:hypothetical protein